MNYLMIILFLFVVVVKDTFAEFRPGRTNTDVECTLSETAGYKLKVAIQNMDCVPGNLAIVTQSRPNAIYAPLKYPLTSIKQTKGSTYYLGKGFSLVVTEKTDDVGNSPYDYGTARLEGRLTVRELKEGKPVRNLKCRAFMHTMGVNRGIVIEEVGEFKPVEGDKN